MKLSTPVDFPKFNWQLESSDKVVFLGSCFAENMGERYPNVQGEGVVNPLGIAFNPHSLLQHLQRGVEPNLFYEKDGATVHFHFHGSIKAPNREALEQKILDKQDTLSKSLSEAKTVFISYGTAWHYVLNSHNSVVCNNHKAPTEFFSKKLFSTSDLQAVLNETVLKILELNQEINIVFTLSPVKHLRDGLIENSRSKANLLAAIHEICESHNQVMYFPSYEFVTEELRDYRFYAQDMAHPSELTKNLIFEKVQECFFSEQLKIKSEIFQKLKKMQGHKTDHLKEEDRQHWQSKIEQQLSRLQNFDK